MNKREIKFRAWHPKKKIMREVWSIHRLSTKKPTGMARLGNGKLEQWESGILMQYTGLKDKNGVEIYEGDIVRWDVDGIHTSQSEIKWSESEQGFRPHINITSEVIGNIYENPNLLK